MRSMGDYSYVQYSSLIRLKHVAGMGTETSTRLDCTTDCGIFSWKSVLCPPQDQARFRFGYCTNYTLH